MATLPPYDGINGIFTTDDKHQDISKADYNGQARPGQIVVDTTDYQVYVSNADGILNAVASSGNGTTGGSNTQIQFNDGNDFGGNAALTFDKTTGRTSIGSAEIGQLEVTGPVTGNLSPSANITYDLGSPTRRWKDLWLSGTTINLGPQTISANSSTVIFAGNIEAAKYYGDGSAIVNIDATNIVGNIPSATEANTANYAGVADVANSVAGANVTGTVGNANVALRAGTVTTGAQPNITSTGTLTSVTTSGNVNTAGEVIVANDNGHGGPGYAGILTMTNTTSGTTTPNKFVRLNSAGNIQIVNSAYSATIMDLSDSGRLRVPSTNIGDSVNSGETFLTVDANGVSFGQTAAQVIAVTPANGINIAGTGGVSIEGVAGSDINIGGGTGGNININGDLVVPVGALKVAGGTNGQVLSTDGSGSLSWIDNGGGGGGGGSEITNTDGFNTYSVAVDTDGIVTMDTARGSIEFGAQPEPGAPQHFHIMRAGADTGTDLFFGDDFNFVQLPGEYSGNGVVLSASPDGSATYEWNFQTDGGLTFPDGTTQTTAYITAPPLPPYRGFYAGVNRFWGDDPSINQIVITNATASPTYENLTTDTNEDDFATSNIGSASIVVMFNVYGNTDAQAFTVDQLRVVAEAFIDNVLYDGSDAVTDAATAKTRFYNNWGDVFGSISGDLYSNFQFFTPTDFQGVVATGGTGADFTPVLRNGTTTYVPDGQNNNGSGYTVGDILLVTGDLYGGTTPDNDATFEVTEVGASGEVVAYTVTGTPITTWPTDNIGDGGSDQYDTGNYIRTSISDPTDIPYNGGDVETTNLYWGPTSEYVVVYENSTWAMMAFNTAVEACRYAGGTGADGDGTKQVGNLIGGSSQTVVDIGDFVFSGTTMSVTGEADMNIEATVDINIQAGDDLFLEAFGDDVHIRAKNGLYILSNYPYGQETSPIQWNFDNQGNIIFPDNSIQNTAWTGNLTTIFNGTSQVTVPNDSLQVEVRAGSNVWFFHTEGALQLPGTTYDETSPIYIRGDYGVILHPSHNTGGVGPELSIAYNDGIEITPITNDYLVSGTTAAPLYVQGAYSTTGGVVPGSVYVTPGRNTTDATYGNVQIGTNGGGIVKLLGDQIRLGNISKLSIDGGNPGDVLSTDGSSGLTWVAQSGGGGASNAITNGTSAATIASADGDLVINVDGTTMTWTFGTDRAITGKVNSTVTLAAIDDGDDVEVRQVVKDTGDNALSRTALGIDYFEIRMDIGGDDAAWQFDRETLNTPQNIDSFIRSYNGNVAVQAMSSGGGGVASLQSISNQNDPNIFSSFTATTSGANIEVFDGGSNGGVGHIWQFGNDGNLTAPGTVTARVVVTAVDTVATLGTQPAGTRAFVNDSDAVAAGNFGEPVVGGGANVVPVWSDGTNWRIG